MSPSRYEIIEALRHGLEPVTLVHALWLEGADATGTVDEFSDIDVWLDVTDGAVSAALEAVETALKALGEIDLNIGPEQHGQVFDKVFHLRHTSDHLFIDVCVQSHSRQFEFIAGHDTEKPLVLFDKARVIRYRELGPDELRRDVLKRLAYREAGFAQRARVIRAAERGHLLEAIAYYHKFVLQPLVELLRLQHAPLKADYGFKHIERDLPAPSVQEIEGLIVVASVDDIVAGVGTAQLLFDRACANVRAKYGLD